MPICLILPNTTPDGRCKNTQALKNCIMVAASMLTQEMAKQKKIQRKMTNLCFLSILCQKERTITSCYGDNKEISLRLQEMCKNI